MTQGKRTPAKATPRKNGKTRAAGRTEAQGTRTKSSPTKRSARPQRTQRAQAKPDAKQRVRAAKKAAGEKLVEARDVAVQAVSQGAGEVGTRARRVASATAGFLSANALPLTLLGLGTGWLALAVQRRRRRNEAILNAALRGEPLPASSAGSRQLLERGREKLGELSDRARELGHDAIEGLSVAELRALEFAKEHPLATSAAAVAAGVGISMALPDSPLESRVLGPAREKLVDGAKAAFEEVKSGVQTALEKAAEVKDELVAGVTR